MRLALLAQLGQDDEVERQLTEMIAADPADPQSKEALIRWHISRGQSRQGRGDPPRRCLRRSADRSARDLCRLRAADPRGRGRARGGHALLEQGKDVEILRSLRAGLDFDAGRRAEAIAELEDIIATSEPSESRGRSRSRSPACSP
jgi:cellulose synthase operon protein C